MITSNSPSSIPFCPPGHTPVELFFEIRYTSLEGTGSATYVMNTFWPGMPQIGQSFCNMEAPWIIHGPWKVRSTEISHDGAGQMTLHVYFDNLDLAREAVQDEAARLIRHSAVKSTDRPYKPSKAGFVELLYYLLQYGFEFDYPPRWVDAETNVAATLLVSLDDIEDDEDDEN